MAEEGGGASHDTIRRGITSITYRELLVFLSPAIPDLDVADADDDAFLPCPFVPDTDAGGGLSVLAVPGEAKKLVMLDC